MHYGFEEILQWLIVILLVVLGLSSIFLFKKQDKEIAVGHQKEWSMKWKWIRYSLYATVLFFMITWFIFPRSLYPGALSDLHGLIATMQNASPYQTFLTVTEAMLPWVMLSPWALLALSGPCDSFGCIFQLFFLIALCLILIISYTVYGYFIIKAVRQKRKDLKKILIFIWIIYVGIGAIYAEKMLINPKPAEYFNYFFG